ncbi:rhodanese-related sulfurtransferase [Ahrensia kielensis]|uniref:oxygen-dependent tRNA uridine(34) hydroxylase TrhO n=1 Tax=Ahrensia kielensis TaxID=76980 RepID=UPI000373C5F2|nr:rhodanese-related sulfurtransferase [Ahrensia kielensis]
MNETPHIVVAALYHFARFERFADLQAPLTQICEANGIVGTLLLASEGINGTIAGTREGIDSILSYIRSQPEFAELEHKESFADKLPFYRLKVRLKKEIVAMGVPETDPTKIVGTYVEPEDWNDLIDDPDTVVIDTRNDYEIKVGTFKNAINPETDAFREFPDWVKRNENLLKGKKIAMFCTGGIRCEKSTAYVKSLGYDDVFHLKGGILKYLENVPQEESTWDGECFVFDERVAVKHGLELGDHKLCRACRHPLSPEDLRSDKFIAGISCHNCYDQYTDEDRQRFAERQKQSELAAKRGKRHIGDDTVKKLRASKKQDNA